MKTVPTVHTKSAWWVADDNASKQFWTEQMCHAKADWDVLWQNIVDDVYRNNTTPLGCKVGLLRLIVDYVRVGRGSFWDRVYKSHVR